MDCTASKPLAFVSRETGAKRDALIRILGELHYRVRLFTPDRLPDICQETPQLLYLGGHNWGAVALRKLLECAGHSAQLFALDRDAFNWAEPVIRRSGDFVTWPCPRSELELRLERRFQPSGAVLSSRAQIRQKNSAQFEALGQIGKSPLFLDCLTVQHRFANCDATVLIHGETGTGKELAARAVHKLSGRAKGPFIPICCGALPDTLVEAELFGHARGAFTDAHTAREGLVAQAEGGTLFLDEVEALSAKGQAALLRFLESLEYRRVGGDKNEKADLRVIAAGNEDLHMLARRGAFRVDLLYRLNVLCLTLPPLRARSGDAALLATHFLGAYAARYNRGALALCAASRDWLIQHDWPGNVRELDNLIHRAVVTGSSPEISLLSATEPGAAAAPEQDFYKAKRDAVNRFELGYLTELMQRSSGNVTRAAQQAGKERRTLGKLLKKHGIDPDAFRHAHTSQKCVSL